MTSFLFWLGAYGSRAKHQARVTWRRGASSWVLSAPARRGVGNSVPNSVLGKAWGLDSGMADDKKPLSPKENFTRRLPTKRPAAVPGPSERAARTSHWTTLGHRERGRTRAPDFRAPPLTPHPLEVPFPPASTQSLKPPGRGMARVASGVRRRHLCDASLKAVHGLGFDSTLSTPHPHPSQPQL